MTATEPGPGDSGTDPGGAEFATILNAATTLGVSGKPGEIAAAAAFPASPGAPSVTGATLSIDGGRPA